MASPRVLITDDRLLIRAGLRTLLEHLEGIQVLPESRGGEEPLEWIQAHRPDIVLLDISQPALGLQVLREIVGKFPDIRVILLSMPMNEEDVRQALNAGAMGYVFKGTNAAELEAALRSVAEGNTYHSPMVTEFPVSTDAGRREGQSNPQQRLTQRQREVLQLIAEGRSTQEIADLLFISAKTVETHRMQLMNRLGIHEVAGLVRYAIRMGLVSLET